MKKMLTVLFLLFSLTAFNSLNSSINDNRDLLTRYHKLQTYNELLVNKIEGKEDVAYHYWEDVPVISPMNVRDIKNITSDYGYRVHPIYQTWSMHRGIDFSAKLGTDVFSTANGVVTKVKKSRYGYGNEVIIKHANGYSTRYAHLSLIHVVKGQTVTAGHCVGEVGSTGLSTGPHLHYEILKNKRSIDPLIFTYDERSNRSIGKYFTTLIALGTI
jgi:murein DD-endopeptidase MepM/ murein hydrolase activator NlpD